MARHYLQKFITDPNYFLTSLQQDVMTDFVSSVSLTKCNRAKKRALEIIFGNHKEQYSRIYDYLIGCMFVYKHSKMGLKLVQAYYRSRGLFLEGVL